MLTDSLQIRRQFTIHKMTDEVIILHIFFFGVFERRWDNKSICKWW